MGFAFCSVPPPLMDKDNGVVMARGGRYREIKGMEKYIIKNKFKKEDTKQHREFHEKKEWVLALS